MARRVVVTGIGLVTPLGVGAKHVWKRLVNGESGISSTLTQKDPLYKTLPSHVAGFVPLGDGPGMLNEDKVVSKSDKQKMMLSTVHGLAAAELALSDAGYSKDVLDKLTETERQRMGVFFGIGVNDSDGIEDFVQTLKNSGHEKISSDYLFRLLTNVSSAHLSSRFGFQGPSQSTATACATGTHSIGDAFRVVRYGDADVILAGGAYAELTPFHAAGFAKAKALSTKFNDAPQTASRPYDRDRDGFVISQGTALIVLEEYEKAKARGARIYSEMMGYGTSGDAMHIISPREDGGGVYNAMVAALRDARQTPESVYYVNSHATSTPQGDAAENRAFVRLLESNKEHVAISSTKGSTGHMLYGTGSVELAFTALALHTRELPPTINLYNLDPSGEFIFNYVPNEAQQLSCNGQPVALSTSSGFGGPNACICVRAM